MSLAPADDDDGFVAGVTSLAPADDEDGFDAAGVLVDVVALALAAADPLFLGWTEDDDLAEAEEDTEEETEEDAEEEAEEGAKEDAEDAAACVVAGMQVGFVVAPTPVLPGPAVLVLVLEVVVAGGVEVTVEVPLGSGLGLRLTLGLVLGLVEGLELGLVVLPLLWLPLDDAAGAVVVWVAVLGGLVLVCAAAGCVDGGPQGADVVGAATPGPVAGPVPSPAGDGSGLLPLPSVAAPLEGGVLMLRAEPMASPIVTIAWRAGGTTDRTTPTANTATPMAKAGRSIASRQSLGRCGARRALPCRALSRRALPRPGAPPPAGTMRRTRSARRRARSPRKPRRWTRAVTRPEKAAQTPSTPLGRLAWAGRDRILLRIRSRPSAPGST